MKNRENELLHISEEQRSTLVHVPPPALNRVKKPRKKRLWLVLLVVVVLAAVLIIIQNNNANGGSKAPTVKTSAAPSAILTESPIPTQTTKQSSSPSAEQSSSPSAEQSSSPSAEQSSSPSAEQSSSSSAKPSSSPSAKPSPSPSTKPQGTAPTGYSISLSASQVYLYQEFTVLVQPYESDYTRIVVHAIDPKGARWDFTLTGRNSTTLYVDQPELAGKWTIYCDVSNSYGTYYGSSSGPYATVYVVGYS